ncbi:MULTISPECIES: AtzE family amidohydrolase [unclassified Pseudomonas]|uniref:AtzE family amidohydrolase n=1 Tax=unclassified Pseudomonas TaxID=196821 RepID=UPI000BCE7101|nr:MULTISPECIES: AtzE family amidohydrolase [unclassified Pseudomonas]PVZ11462.1 aspartyl-tRNA(Asn)/glutamyl-tRNA(Gln) amidotransferase subunit A [Pseudomonas sp. URIL14HWK12:I12]PVZ22460.1 aspartyl-tRNA(Asn)/glutamyl-tRNA(Gln) amidotransferase subunit A [Pseudomonas sp. URIL14HWK12:I10]PVZ31416.1 aspartyl-tRNA(Asn)/glutamyl-tRNA(Gln) amidotransferase subunit A [Pseudomonas sp. URIL14HWK12:I11]SNZ16213.1 aspartyl-tRNA(Asn)/glutamyl-tRNA(Gln) amidotransferase subunit A [Pseudomonas sp. URIL14HWK
MNIATGSIKEIRSALANGEVRAAEIAAHSLSAIAEQNTQLNAWTALTQQRMLQEAEALDRAVEKKLPLPPLAGVPYAVKNLFDVAGHTTLAGARLFETRPPAARDAWAVRQLGAHGGLLSGLLNMDAYAYGFTTENTHYGATHNPHDTQRIAGGSSGGSAAAVAAKLVNFSLGSDTNGSIRVPASLCGVFGLKPTFGRLSRAGTHPFVGSLDHIGPLARRVADLACVYDVLQGADPEDAFQAERSVEAATPMLARGTEGLRVGVLGGYFQQWCDDNAREAVGRVAKALQAHEQVLMPEAELARTAAFIISASEGGNQYLPALRATPELFEPLSRERLLAGAMIPAAWYVQAQRLRRHFQQQVLPLFDTFDVLLAPSTPTTATLIGQPTMRINHTDLPTRASMGMLAQPISFLGLPVVSVPLRSQNGLPIGVQLIAAPFREEACLRAAHALEQMQVTHVA